MVNRTLLFGFLAGLAIFIGGATASQAQARTIYVSPNGSDGSSGSISAPVASLNQAYNLAAAGDTIHLRAGRYTQTRLLWIDKPNLTISSFPGESATLVASTSDDNITSIIVIVSNGVSLINLELQGGSFYGVKVENASATLIRNCRIGSTGRDCIKTYKADSLMIEDCDIGPSGVRDSSNAEGIDSMASLGVTIRRNFVHDTATNGIYIKGGATNGVIERNRIERAGHSGILLGQDSDLEFMRDGAAHEAINCVARNNLVISTGGGGLGSFSGSNVKFENNTLVNVAQSFNGGFYVVTNSRGVPARQVTFKNNIVVVNSARPMVFIKDMADQLVCDSNIWFRPSGGAYKFWRETAVRGDYWESFANWRAGMGVDSRSHASNPMLDASALYKPTLNSPAIDGGESLSGLTLDYSSTPRPQGNGFDIGAHELAVGPAPPPPSNQPPTISVRASVTSGAGPLAVTFTSTASDPDGQVVGYSWDFGDGETSSAASPTHVYQAAGSFNARVTITDNGGATSSAAVTIMVTASSSPVTVRVVTPNNRDVLKCGSAYAITWVTKGSGILHHDIQISFDGGSTWKNVETGLSGAARMYLWTVPNKKTRQGRIRVIAYGSGGQAGEDMSDESFIIKRP